MKGFKEFLGEEDGVAIIEIVLILVILIGLIVVFNTKIKSLNTKILKKITIAVSYTHMTLPTIATV